jgi:hypothetical protein
MVVQNILKVDIGKDNLVFLIEGKNRKIEIKASETNPYTFIITENGETRNIDISNLGVPGSGDIFIFLMALLSNPGLFMSILGDDYKEIKRIILNADLDEAQVFGTFDFMLLDRILLGMGFRRVRNPDTSNVLEYIYPSGDVLEIHFAKMVKDGIPQFLVYKIEGVINLR